MPSPERNIKKLEATVAMGNISLLMENWFKREDPASIDVADSFREEEKKNQGNIPLNTKHVKLGFPVLKIFVKTKLTTNASNIGFRIDHPKPKPVPIYLFFRSFATRLFNVSFL